MADEVASLVLRVDSTQAKGASADLDKLAVAGAKAEQATAKVGTAGKAAATGLGAMGKAAKAAQAQTAAATLSVGEMRTAMRSLPMQMTDIAVGLSTGQSPFYVLLQQGGQLKDLFGGIGPAIKAVGGYVAALVTPFTAAAAGAAALAVAYQQGAEEGRRFTAAITLTGNAAGVTESQLAAMAKRISDIQGTTGNAAAALTKLVETGKIAGDSIEGLGRAAVLTEAATGRSVDEMVKDYERIADAPAEALTKLNERYHFLTLAVYDQVKALEAEGRTQDAARLALNTYAQAMEQRAQEVVQNIGTVERAWNAVTGAAKGAWDAMLAIGREDSLEQKLAQARKNLESLETSRFRTFLDDDRIKQLRGEIAGLEELDKWQKAAAKSRADEAGAVARGIQARKQIEKQFAGPKGSVAAGVRELERAREQEAALRAQLASAVKITSARQELVKFEQRIADLKARDQLSADEKSILANEQAIRQQLELNAGLADQIELQKEAVKLKTLEASAQATLAADQDRYNDLLEGFTASPRVREQLQAQQQIYRDFQRQVRASEKEGLTPDALAARVQVLKLNLDQRLELLARHYENVGVLEGDWKKGAEGAFNDYAETVGNVASATRNAFADAFKGAEDALVQFVTTGKLSFAELADSVIADLMRITVRQSITGPLASVLGSVFSNAFGSALPATASWAMPELAGRRATGGPTLPRRLYEVAENGPELYDEGGRTYLLSGGDGGHVTPLSRNAYRPSMPVTVNVHGVDSQPQVRARPDARGGLSIDLIFRQVKDRLAHDIDAGVGSLPRALERRYGLNRQLA
ncbi:phage tail tape measure protein [Bordetella bronchiseptica]|uniref:phage tail tape measure protein n=1 Tax=Bordetella bronchiseptica TaxID=518 RepID=UPI00046140B5|nr:phage tail tape measure protein [Bordetella bronchiseptica]AWP75690.1 phage tail tape measure protein [Bordetella bronchiseptica]KDB99201.1 prophage tail length tape measure protein [Bordetella bronchiseptica E010]KDC90965.1 prophage tail length tape measure protein [Bordetella bronchiseptica MBORD670]KDD12531.1 prophage tail length tape measure protein [Bordetella bronchiseptica MBORD731]KDD36846.1 prophage tail length tape measure protein [Bordetella bronchiseptica MBORD839]